MGIESITCKQCGAPLDSNAIRNAKQFLSGLIITCGHCGVAEGYTPEGSSYSIVDNPGMKEIAEQFKLQRLDQLEQWERESRERKEAEEKAEDEAIFAELRVLSAPSPELMARRGWR